MRELIDAARHRVATAVNAELTQLYRRIGRRIRVEPLRGKRDGCGKHMVVKLTRQLTADVGKGWSEQQLRHCLRLAETFPDEKMLSTVWRATRNNISNNALALVNLAQAAPKKVAVKPGSLYLRHSVSLT